MVSDPMKDVRRALYIARRAAGGPVAGAGAPADIGAIGKAIHATDQTAARGTVGAGTNGGVTPNIPQYIAPAVTAPVFKASSYGVTSSSNPAGDAGAIAPVYGGGMEAQGSPGDPGGMNAQAGVNAAMADIQAAHGEARDNSMYARGGATGHDLQNALRVMEHAVETMRRALALTRSKGNH